MRRFAASTVVLVVCAAFPASALTPADCAPDELLVTLKPGAAFAAPAGCVSAGRVHTAPLRDAALAAQFGLDRTYRLRLGPASNMDSLLESYRRLGCFENVEPNGLVYPHAAQAFYPNDYYFYYMWGIDNRAYFNFGGRWTPKVDADIDAPEAWDITTGDSSVVVAFIDSGCKTSHPELAGRIWHNPGEIPGNGIDDDHNGYVDDVYGWDFAENDNTPQDTLGHGTATAGVLAANSNNSIGIVGVDWKCKLMILRVLTTDAATMAQVAQAIAYAADNGAKVINISLGGSLASTALRDAINYAHGRGVFIAASSGNDNAPTVAYPAAFTNVVAVGSTDPDDRRSDHFGGSDTSSYGSNYGAALDVVAPGNDIYLLNNVNDTLYTINSSGTSLSAPLVCGIASLLLAQDPSRSPDTLASIIEHSADDMVGDPAEDTRGWDRYMGWGRVSAYQALTYGLTQMHREALVGHASMPVFALRSARVTAILPLDAVDNAAVSMSLMDASGRCVAAASGIGRALSLPFSRELSSGVYLCRLRWQGREVSEKLTLAR
jgi:subtilisin family serine protease